MNTPKAIASAEKKDTKSMHSGYQKSRGGISKRDYIQHS